MQMASKLLNGRHTYHELTVCIIIDYHSKWILMYISSAMQGCDRKIAAQQWKALSGDWEISESDHSSYCLQAK